ncbi:MAG: DUF192 domain-containing protein [Alphaproteobacteria bacterium]|nr:DUF192 domain-containing protein [Alphaproteobacteria bacterium]
MDCSRRNPAPPSPRRASRAAERRRLRALSWAALGLLALPLGARAAPAEPPETLPTATLRVAGHPVAAEVAATPAQRQTGLMNRRELAPDHGMLFVFRRDQDVCMWMKNTYLALSVAFIDAQGRIRNLADMQPLTLDTHCASGEVRYALEMPLGWFAAHQAGPGARVQGLPRPD